ncbi:PGF-pre-PGF domain-containing protein [Methanolobus profundi]|uniref:PGF-pre-PGF domain-containing protein n=1 Tax=Methanolobus profundi TaxID=487685 RepID=A0A1I4R786_9EURY|nr:PGF-pre-PGF domain-containing protein [Methanolobus profundi]SFM47810.1 PGF-pre-PGF domain-containing protein [Methanolobus profundi]
MIKEQAKRNKLFLLLGIVLIIVLFSVISASGAIAISGNGVKTDYGSNITEHSINSSLNFTANDSVSITSLNLTFPTGITFDNSSASNYDLTGFENVSADNVSFSGNVLTISNGSNIIVPAGIDFSMNLHGANLTYTWGSLTNTTYSFNLNTSATPSDVTIYLTIEGEPSVTAVNYTQSPQTWVKNGTTLYFNASITDSASGVKNATVDITSVNASAGVINLDLFSNYWINSSFMVNAADGQHDLPITSYDNVSHVNNSVNFTVWVDNTEPTVTLNTFGDTPSWVNNGTTITLNATVDDGSGSGILSVSVDGSNVNDSLGSVSLSSSGGYWINDTIIIGTSTQGSVAVPVTATDNVSNVNNSVSFNVWVDNVAPAVTAISPVISDPWVNNGSAITLNVSAVDLGGSNASNISSVTVDVSSVNASATAILTNSAGDYWTNSSLTVAAPSEGNIDLVVTAVDNASNTNNSVNLTLNVDNTAPVVNNAVVSYPSGYSAVNSGGTVLLNLTATDATSGLNASSVQVNVSGLNSSLTWETLSSAGGDNFTLSVIVDNSSTGTVLVPVSVSDNATNVNTSQTISVVLDNSAPLVIGISPDGTGWLINGSTLDINVSSTDVGSAGMGSVTVDTSDASATSTAILTNSVGDYWTNSSLTILTSNEGTINLTVSSSDNLSNVNTSVNLSVQVDNTAPVFTNTEAVYQAGMNAVSDGGTVVLNVTVTDVLSGINASSLEVNASGLNSSLDWESFTAAGGDDYTLSVIVNNSSSGTVILPVRASDNATNMNSSGSISVVIDNDGPSVVAVSPIGSQWFRDGDTLDLNATINDLTSGVKNATVNVSAVNASTFAILDNIAGDSWVNSSLTIVASSEGTIGLPVLAYDNASNLNSSVNLTIKIDNTAPIVSNAVASYPSGYSVVNSGGTVLLNLSATETLSGINSSSVQVNVSGLNSSLTWETLSSAGGDNFTLSVLVDNSSTGTVLLPVSVSDNATNVNTSQSISVVLDNSAPLVTGISPDGTSWLINGSTLDINVSSTDVGSAGMGSVTVDTSDASATSTAILTNSVGDYWTNSSLTILTSNEGTINLTVSSSDNLSNVNTSVNLSVKVDNTAPVFTNTEAVYQAGMNAVSDGGTVVLNVTVTDVLSGINASSVEVNASGLNSSLSWESFTAAGGDDYTLSVIVNNSSSGTVILPVRASDNATNMNSSGSISVVIDNVGPTVTPVSPTGSQWFMDGDTLDLNATIIDSGTGVNNATVNVSLVNASSLAILEHAGGNYWFNDSLIIAASAEGTLNLTVVAYDNASNVNDSVNLTIKIDNTEPLISAAQTEYPTGYTAVNNGSVLTLNATVSDGSLSGVSTAMSVDNVSSISAYSSVILDRVSSTDYWVNDSVVIAGADGTYLLNVTATDQAGNVNNSASATFEVIIDNTDPVFNNLTLSTETPTSYGESIEVTVNVSDSGSGIKSVTAAGTSLVDQGSDIWNGTISAAYGANTVTVIATDNASNAVTNTSLSYTGPSAPSSDPGSSSDGGSSVTREILNNARSTYEGAKIVTQESTGKILGEPVKVISVELTKTEVTGVEVESDVEVAKISVSVQKLDSKPDNIPGAAPGKVHSYLNIEVSDIDAENIAGATITFKVEKTWLEQNGISTDDVVLSHYAGSAWEQLETSVSDDDGEYVYYVAKTPGFSTFAISTRSDSEETYVTSEDSTTGTGEMADDTDEMPVEEETPDTPGFEMIFGILGVSLVAALLRPKNRNE